jgi:alkanesulfonate monooxygenase SsuD/methylene tetrahydromethanopterin reductase-like flavin-dependent oxidoreductase (luciferase family)
VKIGIGLPNTMLDVRGDDLVEWARRADVYGFSSLATIGRIAYPNYDELTTLAAAAAVTERIGLVTNVLLLPAHATPMLAKQTAAIDQISGGRLTLGVGVGGRSDDFVATGQPFAGRGHRMDEQLEDLRAAWGGKPIGPAGTPVAPPVPRGEIPFLFGGDPRYAAKRMVRWKGGFTIGGSPLEMVPGIVTAVREAHERAGGDGAPRIVALNYFSLGEEMTEASLHNLREYYAFAGDWTEGIAQGAARDPGEIRRRVAGFAEAGVDELIWDGTVGDPSQVDRLAEVVLG